MISKTKLQSCCGSESYLYLLNKPVLKEHAQRFEAKGYIIQQNFLKVGMIQGTKNKITVTVTIGQNRLNTRCYGKNCNDLIQELEMIIKGIEEMQ